jgi:ERCC4-related helicase
MAGMTMYTPHQARYFAEQIDLQRSPSSMEALASAISGVKVDLNPHQVDAALFAMHSPLSSGALLADEVGLGKTIEAGIVMTEHWCERKRRILLIVPASLRMQWRSELSEKFYINSVIMDSSYYNRSKKQGNLRPFDIDDAVVICSYDFASRKALDLKQIQWDLVVMDEAHRLRNIYKSNNVTGKKLKEALSHCKKLLLTATPLQNNLMELYGLTSIIDEHVFGDEKTFREMYVNVTNERMRNANLSQRLAPLCKRTLRKQVTEYVRYTNRIAICEEYYPTEAEQQLYTWVSDYLQEDRLYALPSGQRNLITMVLRKLLASSSSAISGTLATMIQRLESLQEGIQQQLDLDDYDTFAELKDDDEEDIIGDELQADIEGIELERARLQQFLDLAKSITQNSKGEKLLTALQKGFTRTEELGGQRKAVIFTESRRTQVYLYELLSRNGYEGQIVFLNGMNNDTDSKRIYEAWKERHKNDGLISGSRQADMKAAVVEEFRDRACILIGTEAAAEGINLQFCSLLVNYDLPWNPQRIEQRIGRCHRYGQRNDVVVINFLNKSNAADVRVYELLSQKFRLFEGVFGSSDEVLGSIESGMDFEKRIAAIYQECKTVEEIQRRFDTLQEELADSINEKMVAARKSILENFDEDVAKRLSKCETESVASLNAFQQWMYYFILIHGGEQVEPLSEMRFRCVIDGRTVVYNLKWRSAEEGGDIFLRREDPFFRKWLDQAESVPLDPVHIRFDHTGSKRNFGVFMEHPGCKGVLSIDKLSYAGLTSEEHIVFTVITEDGTVIDDKDANRMLELPAQIVSPASPETEALAALRTERLELQQQQINEENQKYFLAECDKLDAYADDLKQGLEREMNDLKKAIKEKRKEYRASTHLPLDEMLAMRKEITQMESRLTQMQRDVYQRQDEIELENQRLQDEIAKRLNAKCTVSHIMTISFEVV